MQENFLIWKTSEMKEDPSKVAEEIKIFNKKRDEKIFKWTLPHNTANCELLFETGVKRPKMNQYDIIAAVWKKFPFKRMLVKSQILLESL